MRPRRVAAAVFGAILLVAGAGCGDGSEEPDTGAPAAASNAPPAEPTATPTVPTVPPERKPFEEQDLAEISAYEARLAEAETEQEVVALLDDLAFVGHPAAIESVARHLHDERQAVVFEAIDGLEDLGGRGSIEALLPVIDESGRSAVKARVVEALWYLADQDPGLAVEGLIRALGDEHESVRADATTALVALSQPVLIAMLVEAYHDESRPQRTRDGVARVLRQLGETSIPAPAEP